MLEVISSDSKSINNGFSFFSMYAKTKKKEKNNAKHANAINKFLTALFIEMSDLRIFSLAVRTQKKVNSSIINKTESKKKLTGLKTVAQAMHFSARL